MDTSFDGILKLVGTHGRWQWIVFFLTSLSGFYVAFHNIGAAFLAAVPNHWCDSPEFHVLRDVHNWTEMDIKRAYIPRERSVGSEPEYSSCTMYVPNMTMFVDVDQWTNPELMANYTNGPGKGDLVLQKCKTWTYGHVQYISTVVSQWDLVCSRKALGSTVQSSFMGGVLLGCIVFGWISDKFGRRRAVLIALVQFIVAGLAAAWSFSYLMFIIIKFISAVGDGGMFSVAFVIITEMSGRSSRALLGLQYMVPFSVGFMALPIIAYYIRDWYWLQMAISIPSLLLLGYFWLLPESPRWLIAQGRFEEAARTLKAGAHCNGRKLPPNEEFLEMLQMAHKQGKNEANMSHHSGNFLDLFRTPVIRKRSLVISLCWFVAGLVYYGLSFSAPSLGISTYLFIFLAAAVEVPAFALVYIGIERYGRRICFIGTMIVSSFCCLAIIVTPSDWSRTVMAFALLGKFFCTGNFGLVFLYTVELFPTPIRNLSVGTGAMLSRFGSVVSPYIIDLLGYYHASIPMVVFGILCLLSGLLALLLPETLHTNLPETVEEIEGRKPCKEVELINMSKAENPMA